jgi:hypothetical protein
MRNRLAEVDTSLSINHSLLTAAHNPEVAGALKDRIAELERERATLAALIEGGAA